MFNAFLNSLSDLDYWKLLTVIVAFLALWISWSQYSLGKEKLKLDLFEKRFQVFAATRELLSRVFANGSVTLEDIFDFRAKTSESAFLFDQRIVDYLSKIDSRVIDLRTAQETMGPQPVGAERTQKAKEIHEHLKWLTNQLKELKTRFSRDLGFKTWR